MANTSQTPGKVRLLINRNFALLWGGGIVSAAGDYLFNTTLLLWIATQITRGQTWAPLAVGGLLLATSLPIFLIGPIAGVFVDRWDKRQTMLRMDASRAILIALLLPISGIVPLPFLSGGHLPAALQISIIYIIVFLASTCGQFFNPSALALTGDIVDEPYRARATGMTQMMFSLAAIVAPPIAALLFFAIGAQLAILFNALSFVVSFLAVLATRPPRSTRSLEEGERGNFLREFVEGIGFTFGNSILRIILIAAFLVVLYEGAFNTLGIFFLQQNLHTAPNLYGFLDTAMGAGLTIGAALAAAFAQRIGVARVLSMGLLIAGLFVIVYARLTSFLPALIVMFALGFLAGGVNVAVGPLLFHTTPKALIGRVAAIANPLLSLSSMLAIATVSYLDSTIMHNFHATLFGISFGPLDTIFLSTGILATLGGLYAVVNLRGVKLAD
ncbi:MAG TPA: MFS transporter [Ktedonobacteraceae bacterium]|nr:MFS transporter [Ktedonobacteraceae bacterium]